MKHYVFLETKQGKKGVLIRKEEISHVEEEKNCSMVTLKNGVWFRVSQSMKEIILYLSEK